MHGYIPPWRLPASRTRSRVWISVSFQKIRRLVGRLESRVWVSTFIVRNLRGGLSPTEPTPLGAYSRPTLQTPSCILGGWG